MSLVHVRLIRSTDIELVAEACADAGMNKPVSLFERYLAEQSRGQREVLLAFQDGVFSGYLTVVWDSDYPPFREASIPEVNDFNVLPKFRRLGIGSRLMDEAEKRIAARSRIAGIGVGLYSSYGPAQRLYVKRGYVPDGRGVSWSGRIVAKAESVNVDDDLAIFLTKDLTTVGN
jgi:GNAT superfamily N-acetyltransferase